MTTSAKSAFQTKLQYGDAASPEKFTTVAEIFSIGAPEATDEPIRATTHDSPKEEFINSGCVDEGEVTFEANFINDATDTAVRGKLGGAKGNWQLCLPNWGAVTKTFTAAAATDIITCAAHGLTTGQPVRVSSTTTLPAGLSANTTYWVHWLSSSTFTLHTTNAGAVADTGKVDVTDTGTGTHSLQIGTRTDFAALLHLHGVVAGGPKDKLVMRATMKITAAVTWN